MKTTAAELRILERARRQSPVDTRPTFEPLTLTPPVRRLVQAPLFSGGIPLASSPVAAQRRLWSVP